MTTRLVISLFIGLLVAGHSENEARASSPLVAAARSQVGVTLRYDPSYTSLAYPNGDVPMDRGVCTDVLIRALRKSHNLFSMELMNSAET